MFAVVVSVWQEAGRRSAGQEQVDGEADKEMMFLLYA